MGPVQRRAKAQEMKRRMMVERLVALFEDKAGPFSTIEEYIAGRGKIRVAIRDDTGAEVGERYYHLSSL
ncbi:hypothetical protein SEA_ROMAN_65 [Microbacterium phage Roman]|nr:hypothetical protein SEA_ROMAN_65 [Microbacterium phage Roman]